MTPRDDEQQQPTGLSRRTVLGGAAWSVPVLTLAAATPSAVASGARISVVFVIARIELRRADIVAGFIRITNESGTDIDGENLTIVLDPDEQTETGTAPSEAFTVTLPSSDQVAAEQNSEVANDQFELGGTADTTLTLSTVATIGAGESILIALYFERAAFNRRRSIFIIEGSFILGADTEPLTSTLTVDLPEEPEN
ncbi:MAG: hypothetical protein Q7T71_20820 [Herbiconiux sp.]|nr:hypothetical protein [Herbiconiux sp.]